MWVYLYQSWTEKALKNAYIGEYVAPDYLCFTANTAGSTVKLRKFWTPNAVSLETSTDLSTWSDYTIWNTITLSSIGDKVYWRNKSETDTWFSKDNNNLYRFEMDWSISASWDINYLLNKNSTTTLSSYCFTSLFYSCPLTTPPSLPATTLADYCYNQMFRSCTALTTVPSLPATTLADDCYSQMFFDCTALTVIPSLPATALTTRCYSYMFYNCSNIKLSMNKTRSYQTAYRIPTTWTWTALTSSLTYMYYGTWWTFTSDPSVNTTYYTSNTIV